MRLAVVFDNFGPYHIARLSAAGRQLRLDDERGELLGIEIAARSAEYGWMPTSGGQRWGEGEMGRRGDWPLSLSPPLPLSPSSPPNWRRTILLKEETSAGAKTRVLRTRLDEVLSSFQAEVVAVPGWSSRAAFCALRWCVDHRVPAIVMSESQAIDGVRNALTERVKRSLLRAFGAGLVGGESHRQYLVQLGMPVERVFLGYDAVDNDYFARGAAAAQSDEAIIRQKFSLPKAYFLASNRFIPKKNLPFLLRAYARYRGQARPPLWDLVILGDGPLRAEIESLIAEFGLTAHVSLPGFRQYEELPAYYGLAGGFVHASTTEQWGLVVNEAMAAGLPILVSNRCGCAAELVRHGKNADSQYCNGWQFAPDDEAALADLMACVAGDEPSRTAMGRQSGELISSWGPDRFAQGLRDAAQCALSAGPAHRRWLDGLVRRLCEQVLK